MKTFFLLLQLSYYLVIHCLFIHQPLVMVPTGGVIVVDKCMNKHWYLLATVLSNVVYILLVRAK